MDPQVRLAAAAQAIAQERLAQSKSRWWPTVGVSATAGEGNDDDFGRPVKRRVDRSEMLLRWNLYNGGADAAEVTATEREWAATTEDLSQALDLASERITNAYLDAWRWQSLVEPSLSRVKTIERWVEQARTQLKAGRLSDADLQQAEYSLTDAQLSHQVWVSELAGAMGALNALLTEPVAAVLPQTLPRVSAEEARNLTPAGVRVARLRAEAAGSRVVSAANLVAPRLDLDARKRLSDNTTPRPSTSQRDGWSVGMRWEMPLGGETFSKRRESIARAEGAQAEVARIEQGLVSELASIAPRLVSAEQAVAQLQSQAEQYNALLRAGRVQFEAGRRTLQQLIQLEDGRINVVQRLADNDRAVMARKGHPLADVKSLADLVDAEWLIAGLRDRVEEEFEEVFSAWGLPSPAVRTRAESMLVLAVLLATTDALVFVPRIWAASPLFRDTLQEIAVSETLAAPEIVQMHSLQFPLTPAAEHLALLLQRAAGKPYQRRA